MVSSRCLSYLSSVSRFISMAFDYLDCRKLSLSAAAACFSRCLAITTARLRRVSRSAVALLRRSDTRFTAVLSKSSMTEAAAFALGPSPKRPARLAISPAVGGRMLRRDRVVEPGPNAPDLAASAAASAAAACTSAVLSPRLIPVALGLRLRRPVVDAPLPHP